MNKKILVPLVTPFREDESVDYEMLKKLVRYELDSGADGLYVGGSSAECFLLTAEERKKVLETAVRAADGAFVVANIGSIGTAVAEDFAAHAAKAGADVISSVPPFYFAFSFSEIASYYRDLVKKTGLPMMIYNIPSNTHAKFGLGDLESLLAEEGMDYIHARTAEKPYGQIHLFRQGRRFSLRAGSGRRRRDRDNFQFHGRPLCRNSETV